MTFIERLLFKLHITNNLTVARAKDGTALVTIHRTNNESADIRPDIHRLK